uniref:Secreted protein n=1 Tax=Globodera pallida TaxID=36090 RepID=A0A183BRU1_GLOPA
MPKFVLLLISIWVYLILLSNLGLETSGCRGDRPSKTKFLNQCKGFFSREDCNGRTVHGNHGGSVTFVTLNWTTNQQPKVFERVQMVGL